MALNLRRALVRLRTFQGYFQEVYCLSQLSLGNSGLAYQQQPLPTPTDMYINKLNTYVETHSLFLKKQIVKN